MAYGMAGRSPKLAGGVKAQPDNLQRLSPGVYRNAQGQLVGAQGNRLPTPAPQQSQMPMTAYRPTPQNMPQMPGATPNPMTQEINRIRDIYNKPQMPGGLPNNITTAPLFSQPGQRLPIAPGANFNIPQMPQMPQMDQIRQNQMNQGMMQQPQPYSPFMNYLAQQPQDVQNKFAELMANQQNTTMRPAVMPNFTMPTFNK